MGGDQEGKFIWKLNLDVIEKNAKEIGAALSEEDWFNGHVLFLAGTRSDYVKETDLPDIRRHFPNAVLKSVPGAGHWVHAEQPKTLVRLVFDFLAG